MSRAVPWLMLTAQSGIDHYFKDIQRFPMLDPQEEYMLAKRWRDAGDRDAARRLLGVLNARARRIFESRRLAEDPMTLAELADEFGVSRERVRQIEARAFEKVQEAVKNRLAAIETPVQKSMH